MSATAKELADVLLAHPDVRLQPAVSREPDGTLVLGARVRIADQPNIGPHAEIVELFYALQELQDMAVLRMLAARYDIDPSQVIGRLNKKEK